MALVVLIGGLVASVIAAAAWRGVLQDHARNEFSLASRSVEHRVETRLDALAGAGRATRTGVVAAGAELDNEAFGEIAAEAVADLSPGAVASVAYVQPVADADVLDLRDQVRETGVADFNVNSLAPGDDHLIATYEAPSTAVDVLDGLDLASIPSAEAALDASRVEGRAIISDRFESLPTQALETYPSLRHSGIGVVVPVYGDAVPTSTAARVQDLQAWIVVMVSAQDLVEQAVAAGGSDLQAQLEELADPDAPSAVAGTLVASSLMDDEGRAPSLTSDDADTIDTTTIDQLGQRWLLTVVDMNGLGDVALREPLWILAAGTALSVLLSALVWSLGNTRAGALAQAASLTAEVRRTEARFQALVHNLPDLIVVTDDERTISYSSPSVTPLLGWSPQEAEGATLLAMIHPDDADRMEQALAARSLDLPVEARVLGRDGRFRWFEVMVTNLFDDPAVAGLVINAHDVTAQKAVEDRLAHQATHDPLTLLPNRVIVDDRLDHALDRGRRDGSRAAAIFLDIDEFKLVNDTWGHAAGDELLRQVADRVQRAARAADTVGRYGGDEFVVICEDLPSAADALVVAERIRDEVAQPAAVEGTEILVGTSIGVALSSGPEEGTRSLLGRADAAMYEAKATGRGRIVVDAERSVVGDG